MPTTGGPGAEEEPPSPASASVARWLLLLAVSTLALFTTWVAHRSVQPVRAFSHNQPRFGLLHFHEFLGLPRSQWGELDSPFEVDMQEYATKAAYRVFCDAVAKRVRPTLRADRQYYIWSVGNPVQSARGWPFMSRGGVFRIQVEDWPPGKQDEARIRGFKMTADCLPPTRRLALAGNFCVHSLIWLILLGAGRFVQQKWRERQQVHRRGFPVLPG